MNYQSNQSHSKYTNQSTSTSNQYQNIITRSRTLLYLSFRDTRSIIPNQSTLTYPPKYASFNQSQHDDYQPLLIDSESQLDPLPPKWIDYSDEVEELIEQIKINLNQLEKLTSKHLLPSFTDRSNEEKQIDQLTHQITRQFRKSQVLIGKIGETQHDSKQQKVKGKTKEFQKMIQNVQIGLMTKIQDLSQTFQKRQRVYLQNLKSTETLNSNHTLVNITEDHPSPKSHQFFSQQQQQQQSVKSNRIDLEQRDREIEGITQSILELSEMFKDLSVLVIDQGTMLDRIDYHVEEMSRDLKGAVHELKIANKHSNRSGKCKLICLLILLIFAAILLLVFKPRHSSSNTSTSQSTNTNSIDSKIHSSSSISNKLIKPRSKLKQRWKD